eukprot:Rhum_TRINITY_DN24858_c0_g1::Rhum_TRINITY_DN24858_c0_g1_i1::g.180262::m.180262
MLCLATLRGLRSMPAVRVGKWVRQSSRVAAAAVEDAPRDARPLGSEKWAVTVTTPLYEARENNGDTVFYCKGTQQTFADANAFVQFVKTSAVTVKEKNAQDIVFEDAVQHLAKNANNVSAEKKSKTKSAAKTAASEPEPAKTYTVLKSLSAGSLTFELVKSDTNVETLRLRGDTFSITSPDGIRRFLKDRKSPSSKEQSLINLVKTYVPLQPREGYSVGNAYTLVEKKCATTAQSKLPEIHASTQGSRVPDLPQKSSYLTGSKKERRQLTQVTGTDSASQLLPDVQIAGFTNDSRARFSQHSFAQGQIDSCSIYVTHDKTVSVEEFVQNAGTSPEITHLCRKYLAAHWGFKPW